LKTGDSLTIPVAVAIPSEIGGGVNTTPAPKTYTVKSGDSLYAIAVKYSTTVAAIASANNISNVNNISVGQVLVIP
jgi:LysM repeat protein